MNETFWMVLGNGRPVVKHGSIDQAKSEAERLAKMNPGEEFYVLQATHRVKVCRPIEWFTLADLPF